MPENNELEKTLWAAADNFIGEKIYICRSWA